MPASIAPRACFGCLTQRWARGLFVLSALKLSCGIDNVPTETQGSGGRLSDTRLSGGGQLGLGTGGDASGGEGPGGAAGAPAPSSPPPANQPVTFYACEVKPDLIEVRGVHAEGCWLVVLAREVPAASCHPAVETSQGWCVVGVEFGEDPSQCVRKVGPMSGHFESTGRLSVGQDLTLDLSLEFTKSDSAWKSDRPFAVSGCRPSCGGSDCRES